ncbi:response regulator [Pararhizobium sp. BT-229]|uniref:response regulator transcription factor n=1 Tax=Pararhizobium sp. BT-229 TaxID=2986923 RepID=UPI0021F6F9E5|nr:response regulator [Pararhizobium sp. BT-229]MCV9966743.1 response regulator [Pararhizobium sp. BT-229]
MSIALKHQDAPVEEQLVVVIDDDTDIRCSIVDLLQSAGIRSSSFHDALDFVENGCLNMSGCIVLDVQMPGMSGIEFQSRLEDLGCQIPIVFVTGHGDVPTSVTAMKAGAIDFLLKPFTNKELLDAVDRALETDKCRRQDAVVRNSIKQNASTLTRREREVMQHVTDGLMNKQIAYALGISEIMVKIHRASMMRKMGASSLADLVKKSGLMYA